MEDKEYIRFEDLQVAEDGEVILQSGKHTYGSKRPCGHRVVRYKGKNYLVHRMVAVCFLNDGKSIPKGYDVHHINGNPEDNRVENLIILTHEAHRRLHSKGKSLSEETKQKMSVAKKGNHYRPKIPIIGVHKVSGEVREFESAKDAAIALNIYATSITACCRGKMQSAGGWRFEYKIA